MTTRIAGAGAAAALPVDIADAKRRIHPWRIATSILVVVAALLLMRFAATNPKFEWPTVAEYLFDPSVLRGLWMTLALTAICMTAGCLLGVLVAAGQLSEVTVARAVSKLFVTVFRGVPPLVQLIFWFNLAYLVPSVELSIPGIGVVFSGATNTFMTPFVAAIIGLSLHEAAYMAEIIRAGILSVDQGQTDAGKAMGFTSGRAFRRIVLPQAMRVIIPPTGSQLIGLLKGTSLVSVIGMTDLLLSVQLIYNRNYEVVPLLVVSVFWYLAVVTLLSAVQRRIEIRFGQGHANTPSRSVRRLMKGQAR
ncbi:amino acid ABC transporter permease [Nocardia carnea]|uniref:amino acid ABC transporter permease n=1 Tax=Nocardia carnea TaxID=37328 RepID=UPI002454C72B|nr:amino acid ABC transporter permease [Nocardia carnea]